MARVTQAKLGSPDASGWANRPKWKGIVYFEGGLDLSQATGHIDLWNGSSGVHATYSSAKVIWFWKLAEDDNTAALIEILGDEGVEPKSIFS